MAHISEHNNSSNHKIHSYDQMRKMIVNLGNITCENNNNYKRQLISLKKSLFMSIVNTPEEYLPNFDSKIKH